MKRDMPKIAPTIRSSRPTESVLPRPHRDAGERMKHYGPIQPMQYDEPGCFDRLWKWLFL